MLLLQEPTFPTWMGENYEGCWRRDNTYIWKDLVNTKFILGGQNVCKKAWCRVFNISEMESQVLYIL